jgi:hypothetical protein
MIDALGNETKHKKAADKHAEKMRAALADAIQEFGDEFDDNVAWSQHRAIRQNSGLIPDSGRGLKTPSAVLASLQNGLEGLKDLQKTGVSESTTLQAVKKNDGLLDQLFAIPRREQLPFGSHEADPAWERREVTRRSKSLISRFEKLLQMSLFDEHVVVGLEHQMKEAEETRKRVEVRVTAEMQYKARLKMSTIGSSHKLLSAGSESKEDDDEDSLALQMRFLAVDDPASQVTQVDTVVIFDESGCIPSFELLGLSRLNCEITSIVAVGDKKQLPPYDPSSNSNSRNRNTPKFGQSRHRNAPRQTPAENRNPLRSILDVSALKEIKLTVQYRVPRDIADILNARVYNGDYVTHRGQGIPDKGLFFQHVATPNAANKKYVNMAEVDTTLELAEAYCLKGKSIMILTPVRRFRPQIVRM